MILMCDRCGFTVDLSPDVGAGVGGGGPLPVHEVRGGSLCGGGLVPFVAREAVVDAGRLAAWVAAVADDADE